MKTVYTSSLPAILILAVLLIFPGCENPFQSDSKGTYKIAYDVRSSSPNLKDVYLMNSDGSDVMKLTNRPSDISEDDFHWSGNPVWSANGDKLAFRSYRGNKMDVFSIHLGSGRQERLTDLPKNANIRFMGWSPEHEHIAVATDSGVYVIDGDGLNVIRISNERSSDLSWNNNGSEVAFGISKNNADSTSYIGEIHIATADGEMLYQIAEQDVSIRFPEWTSENKSILYIKGGWWGDGGIYEYELSSKEEKELISGYNVTAISLSPKRNKIAFLHYVTLYVHDLYVADIDGKNLTKINPEHIAMDGCGSVSWSPNEKYLLIGCGYNLDTHPEGYGIYKVMTAKAEWIFLGEGNNPSWSPVRID